MFSGIIESNAVIQEIKHYGTNLTFVIESKITSELKVDQSLAHNGVCLTVESIDGDLYEVTAVKETLVKSNLGNLNEGDQVNIERSLNLGKLIDGHLVQGHVDCKGKCTSKSNEDGSWLFHFQHSDEFKGLVVEKGSICINGVSLTAFNVNNNSFTVTIIPYTYEHTNFNQIEENSEVNLEFDILGKYIKKNLELYR